MSKIAEQKALEAYPEDYAYVKCDNEETNYTEIDDEGTKWLKVDSNKEFRDVYTKGYDQAMQDIFNYLEANIPCGEMSSEDIRDFIIKCKEYFK